MAKRKPSAFFVFAESQRDACRAELAALQESRKISVAHVSKLIGEKWRALPDVEKARWKDAGLRRATEAAQLDEGETAAGNAGPQLGPSCSQVPLGEVLPAFALPLSVVKRIMLLDSEVSRCSGDSVKYVAKATELFLELLAVKAATVATEGKRRTVKFADVQKAAGRDTRCVEMGLKEVFSREAFTETTCGGKENNKAQEQGARLSTKQVEAAASSRQITDFFSSSATLDASERGSIDVPAADPADAV